ncbi:MAG: HNH endonuclease, partial [Chitinophagaceae bacterium]|nr:HNH endonuclease [Rubrivivax sp.]
GPAMAHRWSYEAMVGLIPEGLHIDHLCSVRACVNPYHLDPVTPRVNVQRSRPTRSTHCNHGHEFTAANTYWLGRKRTCRECNRIASVYKNAQKAGVLGPLSTERRFYRRLVTA